LSLAKIEPQKFIAQFPFLFKEDLLKLIKIGVAICPSVFLDMGA